MAMRSGVPMTRAAFVKATGLSAISGVRAGGYDALLQHIDHHGQPPTGEDPTKNRLLAAADWYTTVYSPTVAALTAAGLPQRLSGGRPADAYLQVCEHKWLRSEQLGYDIGLNQAIAELRSETNRPSNMTPDPGIDQGRRRTRATVGGA